MRKTGRAAVLGVAAGLISGLFGVGGGVVVVPGLVLWLHFDQQTASATSLATITAPASAALVLFGRAESVNWQFAAYLIVGATLGAWAAARYIDRIPSHWLTRAFAVLMLVAAARLGIA